MKKIKGKNVVSISMGGGFFVMAITGLLMYFFKHESFTASLHTFFGLLFLLFALFHLKNNWKALKSYSLPKKAEQPRKLKAELWMGIGIVLLLFTGVSFNLAPFGFLYDWGNSFRAGQKSSEQERISYLKVNMNPEGLGDTLQIDLRKGPYFQWPTFAFWLEDTSGRYIQTLYVTGKLAKNNFYVKVTSENGKDVFVEEPETAHLRERPEALPVWAHQYGARSHKGNSVPVGEQVVPDGYTGATLTDNFLLRTRADRKLPEKFVVKLEINHSFDWNEYYTQDRFPDDPVYSGNGKVGQPSLVYAAQVDRSIGQKYFAMEIIGRGHHSGKDGLIYTDLSEITTARELVDRVIVELKK